MAEVCARPAPTTRFTPLFGLLYDKYGRKRGLTPEAFAARGWAGSVGGKFIADIDLRIHYRGKNYQFFVDPHDSDWHGRLLVSIANAIGGGVDPRRVRILLPSGDPLMGQRTGLDDLPHNARYALRVRLTDVAEGRPISIGPKPVYKLASQNPDAQLSSQMERLNNGALDEATATNQIVDRLVQILVPIIVRILSSPERPSGVVATQRVVLSELCNILSSGTELRATLNAAKCPDMGATITDMSRELAANACHIGAAFGEQGSNMPELYKGALVSCSLWDTLRFRMRAWRSRRPVRRPCPRPCARHTDAALITDTCYEPVHLVCAPLGEEVVESIQSKLIESSYQDPYLDVAHSAREELAESSDDEPTPLSIKCALAASSLRGKHRRKNKKNKKDKKALQQQQPRHDTVVAMVPLPISDQLQIGKSIWRRNPNAGTIHKYSPTLMKNPDPPVVPGNVSYASTPIDTLPLIACSRCHSSPTSSIDKNKNMQAAIDALPLIACSVCSNHNHEKKKPINELPTSTAPSQGQIRPPLPDPGTAFVRVDNATNGRDVVVEFREASYAGGVVGPLVFRVSVPKKTAFADTQVRAGPYHLAVSLDGTELPQGKDAIMFSQRNMHGIKVQDDGSVLYTLLYDYASEKLALARDPVSIGQRLTNAPAGITIIPAASASASHLQHITLETDNPRSYMTRAVERSDGINSENVLQFHAPIGQQMVAVTRDTTNSRIEVRGADGQLRWVDVLGTAPVAGNANHYVMVINASLEELRAASA